MLKVLVVDDDPGLRLSVSTTFKLTGRFDVDEAMDGLAAVEKVEKQRYDMVLLDVDMPRLNGLQALRRIKEYDPSIIVLIMTAYANIDDAVKSVKEGAYNYISKPIKSDELVALVDRALSAHDMISNVAASAPVLMEAGRKIIGNTAQMQKVFNIIHRLSKVDTPVLIRGESGTGKELVARAIHHNSVRKEGKFVAINCSAIPENLFESELFGHEKGSFTGADARKIGKFQYAEGGTLFLDEVGDMPPLMQVKLLRVLQEKTFVPVGSNREIGTDVRIIAATNRNLEDMIEKGSFREDLFYRLNVIPIFLPSLNERKNDIENMVNMFVRKFNERHQRKIIGVSPSVYTVFKKYDWPGNIRELENVIEHAFILENGNYLSLGSLPEKILDSTGTRVASILDREIQEPVIDTSEIPIEVDVGVETIDSSLSSPSEIDEEFGEVILAEDLDFNRQKEQFEKEFIIKALKTFNGRINQTALHANIPKKTLLRKIEKYGIIAKDYNIAALP
jgi:DNA-binding NtrC family response regulator